MHSLEEANFGEPDELEASDSVASLGEAATGELVELPRFDQETELLRLERKREFLVRAFNSESERDAKIGNPDLMPDEVVERVCEVLPTALQAHKRNPVIRSRLKRYLERLELWFAGLSEEDIGEKLGLRPQAITDWSETCPKQVSNAISWEELLSDPSLEGLVTPEILFLGPVDDLRHPIRVFTVRLQGDEKIYKGIEVKSHFEHKPADHRGLLRLDSQDI